MAASQSVNITGAIRYKKWEKTLQTAMITESIWDQFSNRWQENQAIPNGGPAAQIPDSIVFVVSHSETEGRFSTTIPFLGKIGGNMVGGSQRLKGTGTKPAMAYMEMFYNVHRKALKLKDGTVEGDLTDYYNLLAQKQSLFSDYSTEYMDLQHMVAIIEGADRKLTEAEFWDGDNVASAPVAKTYHPTIFYKGATGSVIKTFGGTTLSAAPLDFVVGNQAVIAAAAALGIAAAALIANNFNGLVTTYGWQSKGVQIMYAAILENVVFENLTATTKLDRQALNAIAETAHRRILPLKWSMGGKTVNYILLITPQQAYDLDSDQTTGSWIEQFKVPETGKGDAARAISGIFGCYRNVLLVTNMRAPVLTALAAGSGTGTGSAATALDGSDTTGLVRYFTPDTTLDGLDRTTKVVNAAGTAEIAVLLGKTTLGRTQVGKDWKLTEETDDHDFFVEWGMAKKFGLRRLERSAATDYQFNSQGLISQKAIPVNESSFLFLTSTQAQAF